MTMRKFVIAASLAASAVAATPVFAADLGYRDQAYEDPRYSDIYRHPAPPPPPIYRDERYVPAPPPPPAYRQEQRYGGYDPRRDGCTPREQVRDRLEARGWQDFHDPQPMGNVVHIRARRPNGRLFDLTLDRCSGEIIQTELIDRRAAAVVPPPPPQNWRYGPPPYERPYQRY